MNQREDYHKVIKIKERLHEESEKESQEFISVSRFENDQVSHSSGTMKGLKESTPKLDGDGILLQTHQVHLRRGENHLKNDGRY